MPGKARDMFFAAEHRYPIRIRLAVPPEGFGAALTNINAWLDENCGADGWAMTPAGLRGIVNDGVAIYFLDATSAAAFVSRWCAGSKVEVSDGAFRVRKDQPTPRAAADLHKTFWALPARLRPMRQPARRYDRDRD
jgi:hypothetical protein